jgi:orotate phosphoribosyltransferase
MGECEMTVHDDTVLERSDPRWARLHAIIEQHSLKRGDFVLSSGRKSNFLFQLRQTVMLPEGAALLGDIIVEHMRRHEMHGVGGLELGAVPLVAAVSVASHHRNYPLEAFFVRKKAKEHGARERIDGHVTDGAEVLLVDDVATTGQSMFGARDGLLAEYPACVVRQTFVVIDRQEGATETLAAQNMRLFSIFKKSDFGL